MTVLSVMIVEKDGSLVVSRQFHQTNKLELEEWAKNMPKLIVKDEQHTFIEDTLIRYVYESLDDMYLVLVVDKKSNMIEDMEIIKLLHKALIEIFSSKKMTVQNILDDWVDVLLAFDDIVTLGNRDSITVEQVMENLKMESAEEKLHNMLMKARQAEVSKEAKKHEQEMNRKRKEEEKDKKLGITSNNTTSFGSDSIKNVIEEKPSINNNNSSINNNNNNVVTPNLPINSAKNIKGLELGKKKKQENSETKKIEEELEKESVQEKEKTVDVVEMIDEDDIVMNVNEKLSCEISKDGEMQNLLIAGDLCLQVNTKKNIGIELNPQILKHLQSYKVKPHPSINKQLFNSEGKVQNKDGSSNIGNISVLKYEIESKQENMTPFLLTFWENDNGCTIEIEYNPSESIFTEFKDMVIVMECENEPQINSVENSETEFQNEQLKWLIPQLDSVNSQASVDIDLGQQEVEFPIQVIFTRSSTVFDLKIDNVYNLESCQTIDDLKIKETESLVCNNFNIVDE